MSNGPRENVRSLMYREAFMIARWEYWEWDKLLHQPAERGGLTYLCYRMSRKIRKQLNVLFSDSPVKDDYRELCQGSSADGDRRWKHLF